MRQPIMGCSEVLNQLQFPLIEYIIKEIHRYGIFAFPTLDFHINLLCFALDPSVSSAFSLRI